jgi:NAD-dependent SIR2 family protein deacetylase
MSEGRWRVIECCRCKKVVDEGVIPQEQISIFPLCQSCMEKLPLALLKAREEDASDTPIMVGMRNGHVWQFHIILWIECDWMEVGDATLLHPKLMDEEIDKVELYIPDIVWAAYRKPFVIEE